jgi:sucrose-phosphate synthase
MAAAIRSILGDTGRHHALAEAGRSNVAAYDWDRYAARSVAAYAGVSKPGLLACDIDNTLTGDRRAAAAFATWHRGSALPFVVATGRSLPMAQAILVQWGLPMPEAFVVDVGTRLMLSDGSGGWRECPTFAATLDEGWYRDAVAAVLTGLGIEPQPPETAGPHKLSFFGNDGDAARIRGALSAAGLAARVIFSHGRLIDVIAPMGGKARAIAAYAARLGLSLAQCVAAGDSGNDADMLTACGHAIVVGNASDELAGLPVRAGLYRAATCHAGGVLQGLARLGLVTMPTAKVA